MGPITAIERLPKKTSKKKNAPPPTPARQAPPPLTPERSLIIPSSQPDAPAKEGDI